MHEYSIVQALMSQVEAEASRHGAVAVDRINLRIGELAGIEVDLLEKAFETFRNGGICSRAKLEIEMVPARWNCPVCRELFGAGARLQCPRCGEPARLLSGDEIILQRVEMEAA